MEQTLSREEILKRSAKVYFELAVKLRSRYYCHRCREALRELRLEQAKQSQCNNTVILKVA